MSRPEGSGPYISFKTGTRGRAAAFVRYIARRSATERDSLENPYESTDEPGFLARNLPDEIRSAASLEEFRSLIAAFAKQREDEETRGRTHFRCTMSFERRVTNERALSMVGRWLEGTFPEARAAALLHHDTGKLHAHVWIDVRLPSGRKISLSPRENRALGELWNRIYCREFGLDERTYLDKVEETKEFKRAKAKGRPAEPPKRVRLERRGREERGFDSDGGRDGR